MLKYLTHKLRTHTIGDDSKAEVGRGDALDIGDSDGELEEDHHFKARRSNSDLDQENQGNYCNDDGNLETPKADKEQQQHQQDFDSELDVPMSNHEHHQHQRAPVNDVAPAADEEAQLVASTLYEQNNSSEEELEVIINGQPPFSRSTPDEFSDTGDEDGVVYEIQALAVPTVKQSAVNVSVDQQAPDKPDGDEEEEEGAEAEDYARKVCAGARGAEVTFRRPSTAEKRKRPIDDHNEEVPSASSSMFDLMPGPPLNFCTSPPLEALKPQHHQRTTPSLTDTDDTENIAMVTSEVGGGSSINSSSCIGTDAGDKNQSTNRRLSGPNNSSAKHLYVSNCPGFKPAAIMRRSFRTDPMTSSLGNGHNERWTMVDEGSTTGGYGGGADEGDSEVERFNFEGIQISYSSPSLPVLDMDSASPPAAKLFHCEAPKRRPLKHHNHQRLQRLQRPCLDFDKMQQLKTRPVTSWRHNNEGEMFCW